jgi:hypothetical protein
MSGAPSPTLRALVVNDDPDISQSKLAGGL